MHRPQFTSPRENTRVTGAFRNRGAKYQPDALARVLRAKSTAEAVVEGSSHVAMMATLGASGANLNWPKLTDANRANNGCKTCHGAGFAGFESGITHTWIAWF